MTTDGHEVAEVPRFPDEFADAWAAVFIDVYEKLKARGELPQTDEPKGDPPCEGTLPPKLT
jgi:hypothetical protein